MGRIYEETLITQALAPSSSSTAQNGNSIDMMGWDGCDFILEIGAIATGGTLNAKVCKDTATAFPSSTDITGAAIVALADTGDNTTYVISVCEPNERFLRIVVTAAVAATISSATAIRWRRHGGAGLPPTQTATQIITVGPGC